MAFYESAVEMLKRMMVAYDAVYWAMEKMNEKGELGRGDKCHAIASYNNWGMKALRYKTMKPPPGW